MPGTSHLLISFETLPGVHGLQSECKECGLDANRASESDSALLDEPAGGREAGETDQPGTEVLDHVPVGGVGRGDGHVGDQLVVGVDPEVGLVAPSNRRVLDLCRLASVSTVEMIRSRATFRAIRNTPLAGFDVLRAACVIARR